METTKKVLIALEDYNPNTTQIVDIAYSFAKAMNAEITLIHVVENEVNYTSFLTPQLQG